MLRSCCFTIFSTGSLVRQTDGAKLYNFALAIAAPNGKEKPIVALETVTESMSGNTVIQILIKFFHAFEEVVKKAFTKCHTKIYVHQDMFKGFFHSTVHVFNKVTGLVYLRDGFNFLAGNLNVFKYVAVPSWCLSHLMCKMAQHESEYQSNQITATMLLNWKKTRMQLMRELKCALNKTNLLLALNTWHIACSVKYIDFSATRDNSFKFITIQSLAPQNENNLFDPDEYDIKDDAQRLPEVRSAKSILDWSRDVKLTGK